MVITEILILQYCTKRKLFVIPYYICDWNYTTFIITTNSNESTATTSHIHQYLFSATYLMVNEITE